MSEKKATKAVDNKFAAFIKENLGIMVALAVMCIFLAVFPATSSSFLTPKNMFNIVLSDIGEDRGVCSFYSEDQ